MISVRLTLGDSLKDIYEIDRKEWVLKWPGQVVIASSQTYWTTGVENGLNTDTLNEFFEILLEKVRHYNKSILNYIRYFLVARRFEEFS